MILNIEGQIVNAYIEPQFADIVGGPVITVEFDEKITVEAAKQKIKDKIDTKIGGEDWPTFNGAKVEPNVFDLNISEEVPILNINLQGGTCFITVAILGGVGEGFDCSRSRNGVRTRR